MDQTDGIFLGLCVVALAAAVVLVARRVRELETDIELVRMAVPVGTGE